MTEELKCVICGGNQNVGITASLLDDTPDMERQFLACFECRRISAEPYDLLVRYVKAKGGLNKVDRYTRDTVLLDTLERSGHSMDQFLEDISHGK